MQAGAHPRKFKSLRRALVGQLDAVPDARHMDQLHQLGCCEAIEDRCRGQVALLSHRSATRDGEVRYRHGAAARQQGGQPAPVRNGVSQQVARKRDPELGRTVVRLQVNEACAVREQDVRQLLDGSGTRDALPRRGGRKAVLLHQGRHERRADAGPLVPQDNFN